MVNKKLACSLSGIAHHRRLQLFLSSGLAAGAASMEAAVGTADRRKNCCKENPSS